jgi:hypothetical protein
VYQPNSPSAAPGTATGQETALSARTIVPGPVPFEASPLTSPAEATASPLSLAAVQDNYSQLPLGSCL